MSYSELIRNMIAEGATPQIILLAVEAVEARETAESERRAKVAERKRRQRERERDEDVTVTRQSQECHEDKPLSRPPNENNSNPPTHTPENTSTRAKADPFPRPDFAEPGLWTDFLANRKAKKLPNTPSAHAKLLRDVETWAARTGWPPGDVLRACVERGWGAIYDFTEQKNGQPKQSNHRGGSTRDAAQLALSRMGHG